MIRTLILTAFFAVVAASGLAWSQNQPAPPPADQVIGDAPPPPGLNDPGVASKSDAEAAANEAPAADGETLQPAMPDTSAVRPLSSRKPTAEQIAADSDSVTEHHEGSDRVKEYRKNGLLRMVRVVPQNGPEQMYMDQNGDGRLDRDALDGPVAPVYFSLYQWD